MSKEQLQSIRNRALLWLQIEETAEDPEFQKLARHQYEMLSECLRGVDLGEQM